MSSRHGYWRPERVTRLSCWLIRWHDVTKRCQARSYTHVSSPASEVLLALCLGTSPLLPLPGQAPLLLRRPSHQQHGIARLRTDQRMRGLPAPWRGDSQLDNEGLALNALSRREGSPTRRDCRKARPVRRTGGSRPGWCPRRPGPSARSTGPD